MATLWASVFASSADASPTIASLNLCTDQLLVPLAPPERIAAVSAFARDPRLSAVAGAAAGLKALSIDAETALLLRPDILVADAWTRSSLIDFLRSKGVRIELFPTARSLDDTRRHWRRMGDILDRKAEAERAIAQLDSALAGLHGRAAAGLKVLPFARRGWSEGQATLLGELLRHGGADVLASPDGRFIDLEAAIAAKADAIVLLSGGGSGEDQGMALLEHPAFARLFPPERRILISEPLTVCPGPGLVAAADLLARRLSEIRPR